MHYYKCQGVLRPNGKFSKLASRGNTYMYEYDCNVILIDLFKSRPEYPKLSYTTISKKKTNKQ